MKMYDNDYSIRHRFFNCLLYTLCIYGALICYATVTFGRTQQYTVNNTGASTVVADIYEQGTCISQTGSSAQSIVAGGSYTWTVSYCASGSRVVFCAYTGGSGSGFCGFPNGSATQTISLNCGDPFANNTFYAGPAPPQTYECCSPPIYWTNTSQEWLSVGVFANGSGCSWNWGQPGLITLKVAPLGSIQFPAGQFCETDCCPVGSWTLAFFDATLGYGISNMPVCCGTTTTNSGPTPPITNPPVSTGPSPPGSGTGAGGGTNSISATNGNANATIGSVIGVQTAVLQVGAALGGLLAPTNVGIGVAEGLSNVFGTGYGTYGSNLLDAVKRGTNVWVLNQTNMERWQSNTVWAITSSPPLQTWAVSQSTNGGGAVGPWAGLGGDTNLSNITYWAYAYGTNVGNGLTNFGIVGSGQALSDGGSMNSLIGSDSSGAGDQSFGNFGVIHWDNVFNGSAVENPALAWSSSIGVRGPDFDTSRLTGIKNLLSLFISWSIVLGCLVWYGDAVRDALVEAMSGNSQLGSGTVAGVAGQIPGVTLSLKALLAVLIVALLVFLPTVLTAGAGTLAYAFGGTSADPVVALTQVVANKSPWSVAWNGSVTRILGVLNSWLPLGLMVVAGANLVAARFSFVWRIPMYVFISRLLWSI